MPGIAAAALHLHLHRRQIQLVMKDRNILRRQLVEAHRLTDRPAAFVHEGRGFQQQDFLVADPAVLNPALKLLLWQGKAVHVGDQFDGHEADIMPVHRILRARIAEAHP